MMTSKEALEKLLHLHICYDCTAEKDCCKTCDSRLCYESVKKDLEVLEILKKHLKIDTDYCGTSEFATHTVISLNWDNEELPVDSKEGKEHKLVKEWLGKERRKKMNDKLPTIKGYCKDCRFNKSTDRGMDIEALCINPILNQYPYERDTDDYISLNGCDYCSGFEPKKEK